MILTVATMESLATKARVSAQETIPGHSASRRLLTLSMKSKPLIVRFGVASFSAWLFDVEFTSTDPSQPCIRQNINLYMFSAKNEKKKKKKKK
jgi:hypothetical protein